MEYTEHQLRGKGMSQEEIDDFMDKQRDSLAYQNLSTNEDLKHYSKFKVLKSEIRREESRADQAEKKIRIIHTEIVNLMKSGLTNAKIDDELTKILKL